MRRSRLLAFVIKLGDRPEVYLMNATDPRNTKPIGFTLTT